MKKLFFGLALLAAPLALHATPTRLLTIDNMNQIVPDDWDATTYYSLSPHFNNHWYADSYANGKSIGWAFLDVNIGTLVVWYNKDFEGDPVYDLAVANTTMGLNNTAFTTDVVNPTEPREKRIKDPDTKLGLGFAVPVSDALTLAVCFRLAQQNNTKDQDFADGSGGPLSLGASQGYQNGIAAFSGFNVNKFSNSQDENAILVSPQFSFQGEAVAVDAKFDMFWPTVDNKHTESLVNGANTGTITQTLKDQGAMNWFARPKLRYFFDPSSSLMLRASYGHLQLDTVHRVSGQFSGTYVGNLSDSYDLVDAQQNFGVDLWDAFVGVVKTWDKGKGLVTWGVGANGTTAKVLGTSYQTRNTATIYNDTVKASVNDITDYKLAVPVVIGSELALTSWCKARGSVQRNFFTATSTKTTTDSYNSDGTLASRKNTSVSSDFGKDWEMNAGFGLNFGAFSWDTALNTGFLANAGTVGIINPLYQSSFTYEF